MLPATCSLSPIIATTTPTVSVSSANTPKIPANTLSTLLPAPRSNYLDRSPSLQAIFPAGFSKIFAKHLSIAGNISADSIQPVVSYDVESSMITITLDPSHILLQKKLDIISYLNKKEPNSYEVSFTYLPRVLQKIFLVDDYLVAFLLGQAFFEVINELKSKR